MRVGVFTPLLSQLSLPAVLKELEALQVDTVDLERVIIPATRIANSRCSRMLLRSSNSRRS